MGQVRAPGRQSHRVFGRTALACAIGQLALGIMLAAPFLAAPAPAHAQASQTRTYDIPAGTLEEVLTSFGRESGVMLSFKPEVTVGLRSRGLRGTYTVQDGLNALLAGSGLQATLQPNGSYLLNSATAGTLGQGITSLPAITVTGTLDAPNFLHLQKEMAGGALGTRPQLDTPFSTTVVTSDDLEKRQVNTLGDVFNLDASAVAAGNTYTTRSSYLTVRGLLLDYANGYKLNSVPVISYGVELPYEDLEQVELLKGLSGFMYGFGTPGGIVNFVTKKPPSEAGTRILSADIGYKSSSIWTEHIDLGGRFGNDGMFGYRLNASHEDGNTVNGGKVNRNDLSLGLDARITSDLTWTMDALYQKRRASGQVASVSTLLGYTGTRLPPVLSGHTNLTSSDGSPEETEFSFITTGLKYRISPDWRISANYSYSTTNRDYTEDWIYISNPLGDYQERVYDQLNKYRFKQWQIMAEGNAKTGFIEHQLVFGATGQRQIIDANSKFFFSGIGAGNLYLPNTLTYQRNFTPSWYRNANYDQTSLFASDTAKLSPRWSLLAGVRTTNYEQEGFNSTGVRTANYKKNDVLTPTVALMYKPIEDTTIYGSYVESLEQGATVANVYANAGDLLKPLKSKQYEFGVKVGRDVWSASAALFRIERGAAYANRDNYYVQDGVLRYQGIELSGAVNVGRWVSISGSLMALDATYEKTKENVGNRIAATPKYVATVRVAYDVVTVPGLALSVNGKYVGRQKLDAANQIEVPGYFIFNIGANYATKMDGHNVQLTAGLFNVANKKYWYAQSEAGLLVGSPRTVGVNAKFEF